MSRRFAGLWGGVLLSVLLAPSLSAQAVKPPVTSHDLAGKENCLMCHAAGVMAPVPDVPANHKDWGNQTCQWCHSASSPLQVNPVAGPITHDLAGKENCLMCHAAGVMPPVPDVPASHQKLPNEACLICHKAQGS